MNDDLEVLQIHQKIKPLVQLAYHIAYKSGGTGSNKITVECENTKLVLAYDPLESSILLTFNGHAEALCIVVNRPDCENTSYSFINASHSYNIGRYKFRSNVCDSNPRTTFMSDKNGLNFHDVPLYSTEEELFQLSTIQNAPSIELLQALQKISETYDFIDSNIQFFVNFIDRPELRDNNLMQQIAYEAWSLLPSLMRKLHVTS